MKKRLIFGLSILLAITLSGCSLEALDKMTDDAINAIGTTVSDAMGDVDVRELLDGVGETVSGIMDSLPDTTSSLKEAVSASSTGSSSLTEGESYLSREEVAAYIHTYGTLPPNFLTTEQAEALGWDGSSDLWAIQEGAAIGGDSYDNLAGLVPDSEGRSWKQCDVNYAGGTRGTERLVYSNDGLIYYSPDQFATFEEMYA